MVQRDDLVESIQWVSTADELPDEGVTLLLFCPEASEPVWPGFLDEETADGCVFRTASGSIFEGVTHWAEMPAGPVAE
jgi:hypothetical protein